MSNDDIVGVESYDSCITEPATVIAAFTRRGDGVSKPSAAAPAMDVTRGEEVSNTAVCTERVWYMCMLVCIGLLCVYYLRYLRTLIPTGSSNQTVQRRNDKFVR